MGNSQILLIVDDWDISGGDLKITLLGAGIFCCAKQQFEVTNSKMIKRRIGRKFIRKDIEL